ncbi:MAG: hypothetical protein ABH829_02545 [archaeon]
MDLTATTLIAAMTAFMAVLGVRMPRLAVWDIVIILTVAYFVALAASLMILRFSLFVLSAKNEAINWKNLFVCIIFRDIVSISLSIVPFFIGGIIAFAVWVGVLKYRFDMEWGKSVLVAVVASMIPIAIAIFALMGLLALAVAL